MATLDDTETATGVDHPFDVVPEQSDASGQSMEGVFGKENLVQSIAEQESGGDPTAIGAPTPYGRALGRYQILPENVKNWSREVLGEEISEEEFLANPELQDVIAEEMTGQMYERALEETGDPQEAFRRAAAEWYSGRPEANRDYNPGPWEGPTVGDYVDQVSERASAIGADIPESINHPFDLPGESARGTPFLGGTTRFDPRDYPYLTGVNVFSDNLQDLNALNQPWYTQVGRGIIQTFAGEVVGGGIEAAGNILQLPRVVYELAFGDSLDLFRDVSNDFGSYLLDLGGVFSGVAGFGRDIKEGVREAFPVYTTRKQDRGLEYLSNLATTGYLANRAPQLGTTIALMLPALGVGSLVGRGAAALTRSQAASRLFTGAEQFAGRTGFLAGGISSAIASRHAEGLMEGYEGYERDIQRLQNEGYTEEEAQKRAAEGAARTFGNNFALLLTDIPQYFFILRGAQLANRAIRQKLSEVSVTRGFTGSLAESARREGALKITGGAATRGQRIGSLVGVGASEAGEEIYQEFIQKQSEAYVDLGAGIANEWNNKTFSEKVDDHLTDPQTWEAGLWGFAGGVLFGTFGKGAAGRAFGSQAEAERRELVDLVDRARATRSYLMATAEAARDGEIETLESLRSEHLTNMGIQAAQEGRLGNHLEMFDAVAGMTDEQLEAQGLRPEDREEAARALSQLQEVEGIYNDVANETFLAYGENVETKALVGQLAQYTARLNGLRRLEGEVNNRLSSLEERQAEQSPEAKRLESVRDRLQERIEAHEEALRKLNTTEGREEFGKQVERVVTEYNKRREQEAAKKISEENARKLGQRGREVPTETASIAPVDETGIPVITEEWQEIPEDAWDSIPADVEQNFDPSTGKTYARLPTADEVKPEPTTHIEPSEAEEVDEGRVDVSELEGIQPDVDFERRSEEDKRAEEVEKAKERGEVEEVGEVKREGVLTDPDELGDEVGIGDTPDQEQLSLFDDQARHIEQEEVPEISSSQDPVSQEADPAGKYAERSAPQDETESGSSRGGQTGENTPDLDTSGDVFRRIGFDTRVNRFDAISEYMHEVSDEEGTPIRFALDLHEDTLAYLRKNRLSDEQVSALESGNSIEFRDGQFFIGSTQIDPADIPFRIIILRPSGGPATRNGQPVWGRLNDPRNPSFSHLVTEEQIEEQRHKRASLYNALLEGEVRSEISRKRAGILHKDGFNHTIGELIDDYGKSKLDPEIATSNTLGEIVDRNDNIVSSNRSGVNEDGYFQGNAYFVVNGLNEERFAARFMGKLLNRRDALLVASLLQFVQKNQQGLNARFTSDNIDPAHREEIGEVDGIAGDLLRLIIYEGFGTTSYLADNKNPERRERALYLDYTERVLSIGTYKVPFDMLHTPGGVEGIVKHLTEHKRWQIAKAPTGKNGRLGHIMQGDRIVLYGNEFTPDTSYVDFLSILEVTETDASPGGPYILERPYVYFSWPLTAQEEAQPITTRRGEPLSASERTASLETQERIKELLDERATLEENSEGASIEDFNRYHAIEREIAEIRFEDPGAFLDQLTKEERKVTLNILTEWSGRLREERESEDFTDDIDTLFRLAPQPERTLEDIVNHARETLDEAERLGADVSDLRAEFEEILESGDTQKALSKIRDNRIDLQAEKAWLKRRLPQFPVEKIDGLIRISENSQAYGAFKNGIIYLANKGVKGTAYHEAFHAVFRTYLTEEQQQEILSEAREAGYSGNDLAIEENIAEDFRSYIEAEGKLDLPYNAPKTENFFQKIWNWIQSFFNNREGIIDLFESIESGVFAGSPVTIRSQSETAYLRVPGMDGMQVREAVEILTYIGIRAAEIQRAEDVVNLGHDLSYEATLKDRAKTLNEEFVRPEPDLFGVLERRIDNQIRAKEREGNPVLADKFRLIKENLPALFEEVERYLQSLGIERVEEADSSFGLEGSIKAAYETSAYEKVRPSIKMFLAFQPVLENARQDADGNYIGYERSEFLGLPKFHRPGVLFNKIQHILSDTTDLVTNGSKETISERMEEKLKGIAQFDPNIARILQQLDNYGDNFKIEFWQSFHNANQNFVVGLTGAETKTSVDPATGREVSGKGPRDFRLIPAGVSVESRRIREEWQQSFLNRFFPKDKADTTHAKKVVQKYSDLLIKAQEEPISISEVHDLLQDIGIDIEKSTVAAHLSEIPTRKFLGGLQWIIRPSGRFYDTRNGIHKIADGEITEPTHFIRGQVISNLINTAAKLEIEAHGEPQVIAFDGKTYNSYSQFTPLMEWILRINQNDQEMLARLDLYPYAYSSLAQRLKEDEGFRQDLSYATLVGLRDTQESSSAVPWSQIEEADELTFRINSALQGLLPGESSAWITLNMADRDSMHMITGFDPITKEKKNAVVIQDNKVASFGQNLINTFANYAYMELDRLRQFHHDVTDRNLLEDQWIENFHFVWDDGKKNTQRAAAGFFHFFKGLHPNTLIDNHPDLYRKLYDATGRPLPITDELTTVAKKDLASEISRFLVSHINDTISQFERNRLISIKETGEIHRRVDFLNQEIVSVYPKDTNRIRQILADFAVSSLYANIEIGLLAHSDPAFYSPIGENSYLDLGKRTVGALVTGRKSLGPEIRDKISVAVVHDVIKRSEQLEEYQNQVESYIREAWNLTEEQASSLSKDLLSPYESINTSDAQGYITLRRFREIMIGDGRWGPERQESYERIKRGENISREDIQFFMTPIKGVIYDIVPNNSGQLVPVYIKYSQLPLFPALTEGSETLENLRTQMENRRIDEVVYESASKLGARSHRNIEEELAPFKIPSSSWRLQVDNPTHGFEHRKIGTQQRKNIKQVINPDATYTLPDGKGELSGEELGRAIDNVQVALSNLGKEQLFEEWGINEDLSISNFEPLVQILQSELIKRDAPANRIKMVKEEGGNLSSPLSTSPEHQAFQFLLFSILNSRTVDTRTMGAGLVQVSSVGYGIRRYSEVEGVEKAEIIGELTPPRMEDGKFIPGSVLLPSYFRDLIPDAHKMSQEQWDEFFADNPDLLKGILYRIPNQAPASIDVIQVAGFLPPEVGDAVVMYDETVGKAGHDFDFDKMFAILPSVRRRKGKIEVEPFLTEGNSSVKERYIRYIGDWKLDEKERNELERRLSISRSHTRRREQEIRDRWEGLSSDPDALFDYLTQNIFDTIRDIFDADIYKAFREVTLLNQDKPNGVRLIDLLRLARHFRDNARDLGQEEVQVESFEELVSFIEGPTERYINVEKGKEELEALKQDQEERERGVKARFMLDRAKELAKAKGLPTLPEFRERSIEEQNTHGALTNRMIDLYHTAFSNEKGFVMSMIPIEGINLQPIADKIATILDLHLPQDISWFSSNSQMQLHQNLMEGKALIGIIANLIGDYSKSIDSGLAIRLPKKRPAYNMLSVEQDRVPVDREMTQDNIPIGLVLSSLANGALDVAKNPWIFNLNINTTTANVMGLLLRNGVPIENISYFLSQPSIREMVRLIRLNDDSMFSEPYRVNSKGEIVQKGIGSPLTPFQEVETRLESEIHKREGEGDPRGDSFELTRLQNNLDPQEKTKAWYTHQLRYLREFNNLMRLSTHLSDIILGAKYDVDGAQRDIASLIAEENREARAIENSHNYIERLENSLDRGFHANSLSIAEGIMSQLFVQMTPAFKQEVDNILNIQGRELTSDVSIIRDVINKVFSGIVAFSPLGTRDGIESLLTGENSLVNRIEQNEKLQDNPLIQHLELLKGEEGEFDLIRLRSGKINRELQDYLTEEFELLLYKAPNEEIAQIAQDLVRYSLLSGTERGIGTFFELIPSRYLEDTGYNEYMNDMMGSGILPILSVIKGQIVPHLHDNPRIVPILLTSNIPQDAFNRESDTQITISEDFLKERFSHLSNIPTYIKLGDSELYGARWERSESGQIVFERIPTLGRRRSGIQINTFRDDFNTPVGNDQAYLRITEPEVPFSQDPNIFDKAQELKKNCE